MTERSTLSISTTNLRTHEDTAPAPAETPFLPFEDVELMQKDAPDVRFTGALIGTLDSRKADTRQKSRDGDRYTLLELYQLKSGDWVAARVAASDRPGEVDIAVVKLIRCKDLSEREQQYAVLEAFGWTWLAKAFADVMGWDHVQELA